MDALNILRDKLIGSFYTRISVGDSFDFCFNHDFWLVAQDVSSPNEKQFSEYLLSNYPVITKEIDKGNTAKLIPITALMRQLVVNVDLDSNAVLTLEFEGNEKLMFLTNTDIVDWQWALCERNSHPYEEFIVGCFWKGEVQVSAANKTLNKDATKVAPIT